MAPVFVPPLAELLLRWAGLPRAVPVNPVLSMALAAAAVAIYLFLLDPFARILYRRETKILAAVTAEIE